MHGSRHEHEARGVAWWPCDDAAPKGTSKAAGISDASGPTPGVYVRLNRAGGPAVVNCFIFPAFFTADGRRSTCPNQGISLLAPMHITVASQTGVSVCSCLITPPCIAAVLAISVVRRSTVQFGCVLTYLQLATLLQFLPQMAIQAAPALEQTRAMQRPPRAVSAVRIWLEGTQPACFCTNLHQKQLKATWHQACNKACATKAGTK